MQPKQRSSPPNGARQVSETELGWNIHDKDYGLRVCATIETFSGLSFTNVGTLRWQEKDSAGQTIGYVAECHYRTPARPAYQGYRVLVWMGNWLLWTGKVSSVKEGVELARTYAARNLMLSAVKPGSRNAPLYPTPVVGTPFPAYEGERQLEMEWVR